MVLHNIDADTPLDYHIDNHFAILPESFHKTAHSFDAHLINQAINFTPDNQNFAPINHVKIHSDFIHCFLHSFILLAPHLYVIHEFHAHFNFKNFHSFHYFRFRLALLVQNHYILK
jgi:hypothetical protein